MARANSLILPRSTLTRYGAYSLPLTEVLIWIGIRICLSIRASRCWHEHQDLPFDTSSTMGGRASGFAFRQGPGEKLLQIGDDEALGAPLRDLFHFVEDV